MKLKLVVALLAIAAVANSQRLSGPFTLTIDGSKLSNPSGKFYLTYYNSLTKKRVTDSAETTGAPVVFKGSVEEPILATVTLRQGEGRPPRKNMLQVYLEPSTIMVTAVDSLQGGVVTGSAAHTAYEALQAELKPYNDREALLIADYTAARKAKDQPKMDAAEKSIDAIDDEMRDKVYGAYIRNHSNSPIVLYALTNYAGYYPEPDKVDPMIKLLPATYRNLPTAKALAEKVEVARKTGIGQYALAFTQNDTLGKPVSLADFKGKYVLVDFWASWCGPCRAENPNVVKAYQAYSGKNFTVFGVSLDQPGAKDRWMKAIHDDNLTWTHVSDLQFWNNAAAQLYGIQAIPANMLIDPQGKIVAKNIRGEELQKKLHELLN